MAPQASQAKEYADGAVGDKDAPQGGKARAEPIPAELVADTSTRLIQKARLILQRKRGYAPCGDWLLSAVMFTEVRPLMIRTMMEPPP